MGAACRLAHQRKPDGAPATTLGMAARCWYANGGRMALLACWRVAPSTDATAAVGCTQQRGAAQTSDTAAASHASSTRLSSGRVGPSSAG